MQTSPSDEPRVRVSRKPGRYAVLLNALAKGWSGTLHQEIQRLVPSSHLYLSDDFRQAERSVDNILSKDYDVVFTGGGDGTIVFLVNAIEERIERGDITREEAPPVGVLRMGTGNALASYLGTGSATEALRALRGGAPLAIHKVNLLTGHKGMYPFAGIGWDAEVLNDYEAFKDTVRDTAVEPYATGMTGYLASSMTRTVPRVLRKEPINVVVRNRSERGFQIDSDGKVIREFEEGDVLYEGEVQACVGSSIDYWGYRIRMFPHATRKWGYFMLRCFNGSVGWVLTHFPSFWQGDLPKGQCTDFLVEDVVVEAQEQAMPYQIAGDAAGWERVVEWQSSEHPVELAVPVVR